MNVGLILSGGMAKGAYQIGALKAIADYVPKTDIKCISCASIGVLNGYAYITDALSQAEVLWKSICNDGCRFFVNQILKSSLLQQGISTLYNPDKTIVPSFYCSLFDICHRNIVYKDLSLVEPNLVPAFLKASVAMPIYNKPVFLDNTSYYDGAMIDNIPLYPLMEHNLDYIICIYFDDVCYKFENTHFDNKIIKITFPSVSILKQSVVLEQTRIDDMLRVGFERTSELLSTIFAKGHDDLEHVYKEIDYQSQKTAEKSLRITGDVLVTNLNKVTQRLTKRKIL